MAITRALRHVLGSLVGRGLYTIAEQQKEPLSSNPSKRFELFCADVIKASGFTFLQAVNCRLEFLIRKMGFRV